MRRRIGAIACAAAAAIALAACGGGGADSTDPAALAPSDVPVYFQAKLRPEGEVKTNTEGLVQTISGGQTVQDLIDRAVDEANAESSAEDISFEGDINPWLGDNAGAFISDITGDSPHAAGVIETTDEGATQDFIDKAREKGDQDREYEGVDYLLDQDTAVGVLDGFLVIGDEQGFKEAVDVSQGGDSLADNSDFSETIDKAPANSLADAYVGLDAVLQAIEEQSDDPASSQAFKAFFGEASGKSVLASLVPQSDSIVVEQLTNADFGFQPGDVTELIGSFPAESFAAFAVADVGKLVSRTLDQLESAGIPGLSRETIDQRLSSAGLSLDEITGILDDLGLFVEGTTEETVEGALVITVSNPEKAQDIIGTFSGLAVASGEPGIKRVSGGTGLQISDPDLGPKPGVLLVAGNRIAVGYGTEATEQALSTAGGGKTLADSPTFKQATAALGDDVDLNAYFSVGLITQLAESLGADSDPEYLAARPYLKRFTYVVSGSGSDGDDTVTKLVAGVEK
ncbi:MAG: DUF3352 domain-containing protein [Actinomycetota bacterium]